MMIKDLQDSFSVYGVSPTDELIKYINDCDSYSAGDLSSRDLTKSFARYIDDSSIRMQALSRFINRTKEPSISEIFTEACNILTRSVLNSEEFKRHDFMVSSEKNFFYQKGRYIKPDVGIWHKSRLLGVIECKTNLGYSRESWEKDFILKKEKYVTGGVKDASIILLVATESNWSGFPSDNPCTSNTWLTLGKRGTWFGGKNNNDKLTDSHNPELVESMIRVFRSMV